MDSQVTLSPPRGFSLERAAEAAISQDELRAALAIAQRACDRAREEILPRFRDVAVETKRDGSPVTEADREAERAIQQVIAEAFPEDGILGEEFGDTAAAGRPAGGSSESVGPRRRWIIDPIDGTIAYARGIPLFTTLIALSVDDVPVLGVIDLPAVGDRIAGFRGGGLWRGDTRLVVARPDRDGPEAPDRAEPQRARPTTDAAALQVPDVFANALVCHGDLFCFDRAGLRPVYDRLAGAIPKLRGYTDAFGHLLVLSGAADAMVDCDLNPWDAAVTRALAPEAGLPCWLREREAGQKLDLVFGRPPILEAIGRFF